MRADARRNRDAVLAHAERLFTAQGFDVPLEEISREAGVSIATLYRHFPSRADLVRALVEAKLTPIAQYAIRRTTTRGGRLAALWAVLAFSAERHTTDVALAQLWRTVDDDTINEVARQTGLWQATEQLLADCHEARPDVTVLDIARTFYALAGVVEAGHGAEWRRFTATYLRGMLVDGAALDPIVRRTARTLSP